MKCKCGFWECPYVEETNGQCCIPEKCPEWQDHNNIGDAIYEFTEKEYDWWFRTTNEIGRVCQDMLKDRKDLPVGSICYLDY